MIRRHSMHCFSHMPRFACQSGLLVFAFRLIIVVVACAASAPFSHAAPCMYEVVATLQGPPCPPFGTPPAIPQSINDRNEVVGYYKSCGFGTDRAFYWRQDTGLVSLSFPFPTFESRAYDVSNNGAMTGYVEVSGNGLGHLGFAIIDGRIQLIGMLPGGNYSETLAINDRNAVAGYTGNSVTSQPAASEAYIWSAGLMTGLNPVLGVTHSSGQDINSDGLVTGWLRRAVGEQRFAFITDGTVVTELGPIPGGISSEGWAINRWGDVAGMGLILDESGEDYRLPFRYLEGTMEVGTPLPSYDEGFALGINSSGVVVGYVYTFSRGALAFIWDADGLHEAGPFVCPRDGMQVWELYDINDAGWMVGGGLVSGEVVGIVLRPIADPADLNRDGAVTGLDLAILLGSWGRCRCPADLDLDGTVDGVDIALLLAEWSPP